MNYGLYLSASGVLTSLYRQDVFANNLANVETAGFKPDVATTRQRSPESIEDPVPGSAFRSKLLDKLGGGVLAGPQTVNLAPGQLKPGGALDVALEGENAFFAIETRGPRGESLVRLTRDGRFSKDSENFLITPTGQRVLDKNDRPIQLRNSLPVEIDATGRVRQGIDSVGQIQVTGVSDTDRLRKTGGNLFAWEGKEDIRTEPADGRVRQGFVESSGVDPVKALMQLVEATKAATNNGNMIRYHDLLMDRAVNTLGRVA